MNVKAGTDTIYSGGLKWGGTGAQEGLGVVFSIISIFVLNIFHFREECHASKSAYK